MLSDDLTYRDPSLYYDTDATHRIKPEAKHMLLYSDEDFKKVTNQLDALKRVGAFVSYIFV